MSPDRLSPDRPHVHTAGPDAVSSSAPRRAPVLSPVGESPRSPTPPLAGTSPAREKPARENPARESPGRENGVWIAPSATDFSCLCEHCLELARGEGGSFLAAVRAASVRGRLPTDTDVGFIHCAAGHELVVRRVDRPPTLARPDARQLQLT